MANDYTVYVHEAPSGKRYVGITSRNVNVRWENGKGYKNNTHFWNAIQKYNWNNISHYILFEGLTKEQAENKEIELIALWNTTNPNCGYNHTFGGNCKGKVTEETKRKLSQIAKEYFSTHRPPALGTHLSSQTRLKISAARKGTKWSDETREKILKSKKENPYHHTEDSILKIKAANAENYIKSSKKICQYNLNGEYIRTFNSIREASRITGINRQQLSACCKGTNLNAGGYHWKSMLSSETLDDSYKPRQNKSSAVQAKRKYQQYSLDKKLICNYDSIEELRNAGFNLNYVRRCCNGERQTYGGYIWKYREDDT